MNEVDFHLTTKNPRLYPQHYALKSPVPASRWARIRLLAMEVDGILTDGKIHLFNNGTETKIFSLLDSTGIEQLLAHNIAVAWFCSHESAITAAYAARLKIPHFHQGKLNKLTLLRDLAAKRSLLPDQVAYIGDDIHDLPALRWAGIGITIPESFLPILRVANYITHHHGGDGAVREVCNILLTAKKQQLATPVSANFFRANLLTAAVPPRFPRPKFRQPAARRSLSRPPIFPPPIFPAP
ncbi:MAG: HAD hydrolase family protein [Opitutaceae bacterium]|jgi:3-deoxy-D-manno-octulosonate 8-phosphate phosphatase (KDO 8-P phosphatase)|nr:HAD hydrolase family protein [Opitutaceae bacterium]